VRDTTAAPRGTAKMEDQAERQPGGTPLREPRRGTHQIAAETTRTRAPSPQVHELVVSRSTQTRSQTRSGGITQRLETKGEQRKEGGTPKSARGS